MKTLLEYGLFLAEVVTILVALLVVINAVAAAIRRGRGGDERSRIQVTSVNERLRGMRRKMERALLPRGAFRKFARQEKRRRKRERRGRQPGTAGRRRVFVLDFHGDMRASAVEALREEITAVLTVAGEHDEVLVRLESPGGVVHGYGLAASQLGRVRERGIALTVAVDKVAASGGYLMACVADRVLAAPFAILGSIGVIGQLPNFNRLLKRHDIDFEQHTAGQFKRTLTVFGENTEQGRAKFREELEQTHRLFKDFVRDNRPALDVESVATGEFWYGTRARELGLADELSTSDDYLLRASRDADVYEVRYVRHKHLGERLSENASATASRLLDRIPGGGG
ncbi:MAG TPA: protease SohB [Gammaproteobacteria bacterium]|nr:protease SohB [Gammaproteobacteria bacterium]